MLVDGVLVALAYFLGFWLRFADGFKSSNDRYEHLFTAAIIWVVGR